MTAVGGSLRSFVVSRFIRLYPAFWVCCTITFVAVAAIGAPRYTASLGQYAINLSMLSEFVGVDSIDGSYWSLYVEMRFYALVGVVLLLGRIRQAEPILAAWLIASVALEILPIAKLRFLLIAEYSAYFIAGATCFMIWSRGLTPARAAMILVSWGLALHQSIQGLPQFEKTYNTRLSVLAITGITTAFFSVMLLISLKRTGVFGRKRWQWAGVLTYPLYLLHQKIGFMIFNSAYPAVNAHLLLWGTLASVLAAACAVHVFVEKRYAPRLKRAINDLFDAIPIPAMRAGACESAAPAERS